MPIQQQWVRALGIFVCAGIAIIALFWRTVQSMVDVWAHSRTFAHGFLILPATLYLVWCYRDRLAGYKPVPNAWGLVFLVILGCGWIAGEYTEALLVQQAAVITMLAALVLVIFGSSVFHAVGFPLGFLAFAIPVGTSIEPWLQSITAQFIVTGLNIAGIPLTREGNFIMLSSGTWEVAPDCGGLRYILPGLALGYAFTAALHHTIKRRVHFLLVCLLSLTLANGSRAYGIILLDHLGIAEGTDHRVFSYAIYGVTMLLLAWLGLEWSDESSNRKRRACKTDLVRYAETRFNSEKVILK